MLSRMGWRQGQGLGLYGQGIVEPIDHTAVGHREAMRFKQGIGFKKPELLRSEKIVDELKRQVCLNLHSCTVRSSRFDVGITKCVTHSNMHPHIFTRTRTKQEDVYVASYMHMMRVYITSCQMQTEQHHVFCSSAQACGIPLFVQQQQHQLLRHQLSAMAEQFLLGQQQYIQVRFIINVKDEEQPYGCSPPCRRNHSLN